MEYYKKIVLLKIFICLLMINPIQAQDHPTEQPRKGPSVDFSHGPLEVSDNSRFLQHSDGEPFFYLGDTAWELFHRLDREEAEKYLENRRAKGFTVIQAVVLAELNGLNEPNPYGETPLIDNDPARPNEAYFNHVDFVVETAREKGMYIGMLPTWGDKWNKRWGEGPEVFTPGNAREYGRYLGDRYRDYPNIIWILGGDRIPEEENHEAITRAMAEGINEADGDNHLMTFHPMGGRSSSEFFHEDEWLDFNMLQSSHGSYDNPNYKMVASDYNLSPVKPVIDGEPRYEDHPVDWDPDNGWFNDFDVRQATYWGIFSGGFGITYGCHNIWQMYEPGLDPISSARHSWQETLDLAGAWDMLHVRNLMESRPLKRAPDQSLLVEGPSEGAGAVRITRGEDYAFIYIPTGREVTINTSKISGDQIKARWYNPRTGEAESIGTFSSGDNREFYPPGEVQRGNDWVLVIDNASAGFTAPGQ